MADEYDRDNDSEDEEDDEAPDPQNAAGMGEPIVHPPMNDIYTNLRNAGVLVPDSTFRHFQSMWRRWHDFCIDQQPPRPILQGGNHIGLGLFSSATHNVVARLESLDTVLIERFFTWLVNQPGTTSNLMRKAKTWMNAHARTEARHHGEFNVPHGFTVGTVNGVTALMNGLVRRDAQAGRNEFVDMQAFLDVAITPEQKVAMMFSGLRPDHITLSRMHILSRFNFCAVFSKAFLMLKRGHDFRKMSYCMLLMRHMETVGPNGGSDNPHVITNEGKTNIVGNYEHSAFVRHCNPLQDAAAWDGIVLLQRYVKMGEPFFDILDYESWYNKRLYRPHQDRDGTLNAATMSKQWKAFYCAHGVICSKVTHQPRKQGQQELDAKGVPISDISRMTGHKQYKARSSEVISKTQQQSYMGTPSVRGCVAGGGGDKNHPESHNPGWGIRNDTIRGLLDELVAATMPSIPAALITVQQYRSHLHGIEANNAPSHAQLLEQRLVTANGCMSYFKFAVESAFLMLAARPVLRVRGVWKLQVESPILYDLSDRENHHAMFSLPVFQSQAFAQLRVEVARSQQNEMNMAVHIEAHLQTVLTRQVTDNLEPRFSVLTQQMLAIQNQQADMLHQQSAQYESLRRLIVDARAQGQADPGIGVNANVPAAPPILAATAAQPVAVVAVAARERYPNGAPIYSFRNDSSQTLHEYWNVFEHGSGQGQGAVPSLRRLEKKYGTKWRPTPALRTFWSRRKPVFALILYFKIVHQPPAGTIEEAIAMALPVYESGQINGRRNIIRSGQTIRAWMQNTVPTDEHIMDRLVQDYVDEAIPCDE